MPYRRSGRRVLHKVGRSWRTKQKCRSISSAKRAMRLLRGISHGWHPTGRKRRKR